MNVQTELAHAHSELIICHSKNTSLDGSQLIISTSVPFFFVFSISLPVKSYREIVTNINTS